MILSGFAFVWKKCLQVVGAFPSMHSPACLGGKQIPSLWIFHLLWTVRLGKLTFLKILKIFYKDKAWTLILREVWSYCIMVSNKLEAWECWRCIEESTCTWKMLVGVSLNQIVVLLHYVLRRKAGQQVEITLRWNSKMWSVFFIATAFMELLSVKTSERKKATI